MERAWFVLKHAGIVIGSLMAIYSLLWAMGLALVTNNQTKVMINEAINEYRSHQVTFLRGKFAAQDERIDKLYEDYNNINAFMSRIDERTKTMSDSLDKIRSKR